MGQKTGRFVVLAQFIAPVTKYSTMVLEPWSLLRVVRRAIKIATTPPMNVKPEMVGMRCGQSHRLR